MALTDRACTWKDRPCHFTWKLDSGDRVKYKRIVEEIDCDLETTRNLFTVGNLLFRAYLEVSNYRDQCDVSKAREFLDKADEYILDQAPPDFRNGYKSVALLNRMWIEQKTLNDRKVNSLLAELNELELTEKDTCVINTVKASGLTRLGPHQMDFALELFEAALKHFPKCPDFLFGAVLMTGRKFRYERRPGTIYKELDKDGKTLLNKQKTYCEKLMKVKDEYQLGRSFLGQNLKQRGKRFQTEARDHLEEAFEQAPTVRATFKNLIRYYRYHDVEKAIAVLKRNINKWPYMKLAESHFQLALCYIRKLHPMFKRKFTIEMNLRRTALIELDKCLELDKMHLFALTKKLDLMTECGDIEAARALYEDKLLQYQDLTLQDKFHLSHSYAKFLDKTDHESPSRIDKWQRVMEISTQFEYQNKSTGKWNLGNKIKSGRDDAYSKLITHYKRQKKEEVERQLGILYLQKFKFAKAEETLVRQDPETNVEFPLVLHKICFKCGCKKEVSSRLGRCQSDEATGRSRLLQTGKNVDLQLGILYLQKFKFAKAEETLGRLDPESNFEIPMHLAEIRFKWGCEAEVGSHLGQCQSGEATGRFRMARENVVTASKMRKFDETRGRKLLADIALWTAHNRLTSEGLEGAQPQSAQPDSVKEACLDAYREAIRCGSLVASLELVRLIQKGHLKTVPRSMYIRILAEIDICCSRDASDFLHTEYKPLSFKEGLASRDADSNQMGIDCDTIKQDITDILSVEEFYSDARKEYFDMERKILQEDPRSTSITLMLSEEGGNSAKLSDGVVKAAVDCCEKARPLLDHIVVKFQMEELKFSEERKKQYFPLKKETNRTKVDKEVKESLESTFDVDLKTHYPKLYDYILQIQPGINPEYECLLSLCEVVGKSKHASRKPEKLLSLVEDPVKMARQSMDKVEEICNVFLVTMKDCSKLDKKVDELVSNLRSGSHEQADQLLKIIKENDDFVCRIRSTWKFIKILALVQKSRNQPGLGGDPDGVEIKLAEGTWDLSKKLRRSHLAVEVALLEIANPSSNEVLEKCKDTCQEADDLLKTVMETKKKNHKDGKVVEFPFKDLHLQGPDPNWGGRVKRQLEIDTKRMGVTQDVNLIKSVLKVQPCTNLENYKFLAMRHFAQKCNDEDAIQDTVSIQTDIPDTREYKVVDLVRWCTDNVEKIAVEINELKPKVSVKALPSK